ncbi:MAG: hypothetical protein QXX51_05035 [Candidatus Bathyarchaeia archaeon]
MKYDFKPQTHRPLPLVKETVLEVSSLAVNLQAAVLSLFQDPPPPVSKIAAP